MANIFAFAETRGGDLRKIAFEAVTEARTLADTSGGSVSAFVAGAPGVAGLAAQLGKHGADTVIVAEHPAFDKYNPEAVAAIVADQIRTGDFRIALFPTSALGSDLAPRVAAKLGVGLVTDVTEIRLDADAVVVKHPVNIGKVLATVRIASKPALIAIRANMFTPAEQPRSGTVVNAAVIGDPSTSRVVVKEVKLGGGAKLDLGEAPVIISGGRGLRGPENFKLVEDLAAAFGNAAVGATRVVTDEGWRPHSDQIGQTGRLVSPQLYVAVGISGAIQHLAGMRTSRTIVAINKDREAPIFKIADYGVVGDLFEIVPALTAAVKEARSRG
jgi:electron transfer flavoprotein alpha subunit